MFRVEDRIQKMMSYCHVLGDDVRGITIKKINIKNTREKDIAEFHKYDDQLKRFSIAKWIKVFNIV